MVINIRFEVPQKDIIPGVAAVRASCDVIASGEPLTVLANRSARSTLATSAGPCSITLILGGVDVPIPGLNGTPLGRNSFYIPGVSTLTLGIVDVSLDLVALLRSSSVVEDGPATVSPQEIEWMSWGAERIRIQADGGFGSVVESSLNTTFVYRMSLALTIYALGVPLYHVDLMEVGSAIGSPSVRTPLSVDLWPHPLVLHDAEEIGSDSATLSWSGAVDGDVDHLELWLVEDSRNVSIRLAPDATQTSVPLRPSTPYRAWIVSVDSADQETASNGVAFESAASTITGPAVGPSGAESLAWALVAVAALLGVVGYAVGRLRGRKDE